MQPTIRSRPAAPYARKRDRLAWTVTEESQPAEADGEEIRRGLKAAPKQLPCRFFYDEIGSELFERICDLPEYYLTRTENALLAEIAPQVAARTGAAEVVELGSGSSIKTQHLLDAYAGLEAALRYVPIDVSPSALELAAGQLLKRYPRLSVHAVVGTYEAGLARLSAEPVAEALPRLLVFLGSTIGNLTAAETDRFLDEARQALKPGDWLLIGTDLEKDPALIEAAYNDSQGVTAAFNLNILRHINRRYRADFALDRFFHRAFYNEAERQIEMHLVSTAAHEVRIAALGLAVPLARMESIETEISRKFDLARFATLLSAHGFAPEQQWRDERRWFGLTLARAG